MLRDLGVTTPSQTIVPKNRTNIEGLPLADPEFALPRHIEVLLGTGIYISFLLAGLRHESREVPVAVCTVFEWVLIGPIGLYEPSDSTDPSITIMALTSHQKNNKKFSSRFMTLGPSSGCPS